MRSPLERLAAGETLCGDGAWGTQLMARGLAPGACPESMNLSQPEVLAEVATLYLDAGADLVTTNTFGGSPSTSPRTDWTTGPKRSTARLSKS